MKAICHVKLIYEEKIIKLPLVRPKWLEKFAIHLKTWAQMRNMILTVEEITDNNWSNNLKNYPDKPGIICFGVVPAKQDREPFPSHWNILQFGTSIENRSDCDSVYIGEDGNLLASSASWHSDFLDSDEAWGRIYSKITKKANNVTMPGAQNHSTSSNPNSKNNAALWNISMQILSGFISVLGIAAIACSVVLLSNPIAICIAATIGAGLFVGGLGLFFSIKKSLNPDDCDVGHPSLVSA